VHGFDIWKQQHDQKFGNCYNDNDNNVSSPVVASEMMKSRHEATTSSFGAIASTNLCLANPSSFDNSFQQTSDDGVGPLVMSFFSEMQHMKAHGELFKPACLHGNNYNNNNNTNSKRNPRTQSQ
jgi:hypothetical protein